MILRLLPVCSVLLMKSGARLRKLGVEPQGSRKCTKMCDFANPQSHSYLYTAWIQKKKALAFFFTAFFLLRFFLLFSVFGRLGCLPQHHTPFTITRLIDGAGKIFFWEGVVKPFGNTAGSLAGDGMIRWTPTIWARITLVAEFKAGHPFKSHRKFSVR